MTIRSFARSLAVIGLLVLAPVSAQEKLTLTTPVTQASITDYQVNYIGLSRGAWTVLVELKPNNTALPSLTCTWGSLSNNRGLTCSNGFANASAPTGGAATGQAMITALNKANLSTNSLEKRIYQQLIDDGAFVGSITGTPQ